ncbi:hypothetical protein AVEN_142410-1 [Araneus ventricosus]|uniref:Uncharacterized protein n=1 Tax=Araneus ventricosus TaxID=182803 RepID=A0A4Y2JVL4_ARAVE|nr:hypothetical protein AVEN_142410-1 [Araneus ventricosus]
MRRHCLVDWPGGRSRPRGTGFPMPRYEALSSITQHVCFLLLEVDSLMASSLEYADHHRARDAHLHGLRSTWLEVDGQSHLIQ